MMRPETLSARGLAHGDSAVLAFQHPSLPLDRKPRYLAVQGRIYVDETVQPGVLAVDQTIRNGLGIPLRRFSELASKGGTHHLVSTKDLGGEFYLVPANEHRIRRIGRWAAALFGIRYLVVRCEAGAVPDIEKNYVRVPADALKTLGTQEGDDVIIERPMAIESGGLVTSFAIVGVRIAAFSASESFLKDREELRGHFPDRYPNAQKVLYEELNRRIVGEPAKDPGSPGESEPDVPHIFMDREIRERGTEEYEKAGVADYLTTFMIRRSVRSAAARDALQTGIASLVTWVQFTLAFKGLLGSIGGLAAALVVGALLLVCRLRQQV